MRRLIPLVLAIAVACGSDSPTQPTNASIAGTWSLTSVNGAGLPFVVSQTAGDKVELVGDVVTATATGTYTERFTFRETLNGVVTTTDQPDNGTYTINGNAITLHSSTNGSITGALNGNTFTLIDQGFVFLFTKQ
jgi:lipocalin-like protein